MINPFKRILLIGVLILVLVMFLIRNSQGETDSANTYLLLGIFLRVAYPEYFNESK